MIYFLFILIFSIFKIEFKNSVKASQVLYIWVQAWTILIILNKEYFKKGIIVYFLWSFKYMYSFISHELEGLRSVVL